MNHKKRNRDLLRIAGMLAGAGGMLAGVGALLAGRAIWSALTATPLSLRGKVVLITGASRGLGLAIAEQCAKHGSRLAICGRDQQSLARAEHNLRARGAEVLALCCDVSKRNEVEQMVHEIMAHYGKIDVLINNAGTIAVGPLKEQNIEDFQSAMNVMFWGAVHTVLLVLPQMLQRGEGRIANITSIGGRMAVPHLLPYSAAKFAATGFSEGITAELASEGIKVTTVTPGLMRTGSHVNASFKGDNRAEYAWFGVSASAPLLAMDAARAARKIVQAIRRGDVELTLGMPAKFAALAHGLAPATTVRALGMVNRALPNAPGTNTGSHYGYESEGTATKSPLTIFGKRAARRWNQKKPA